MSDMRTVILTGASRGIGHAPALRFADAGWRVITCPRDVVPAEFLIGVGAAKVFLVVKKGRNATQVADCLQEPPKKSASR